MKELYQNYRSVPIPHSSAGLRIILLSGWQVCMCKVQVTITFIHLLDAFIQSDEEIQAN